MNKSLILFIFLVALAGCSRQFGSDIKALETKINIEKNNIGSIQSNNLIKQKKYKHIPEYEKDGVKYSVTEYQMPNSNVGYQIIVNDSKTIKSTCVGNDCDYRNYEEPVDLDHYAN